MFNTESNQSKRLLIPFFNLYSWITGLLGGGGGGRPITAICQENNF